MGLLRRFRRRTESGEAGVAPQAEAADAPAAPEQLPEKESPPPERPSPPPAEPPPLREPDPGTEIRVSRTLVKSEPELAALVASEPTLAAEGVRVSLSEKGFGTRVAITAAEPSGLSEADLERLLDALAEPQKRPFTNN